MATQFSSRHVQTHVTRDRPHNLGSKFASQPTIIVAREIPGSISITTQAASRQQIAHHDQGYCQFRKKAQQDSRLVPSLRLVLLPTIVCRIKRYLESVGNDRPGLAAKGSYDTDCPIQLARRHISNARRIDMAYQGYIADIVNFRSSLPARPEARVLIMRLPFR